MEYKKVILIILDGVGVGLLPNQSISTENKSTFEDILKKDRKPNIPTLESMGFLDLTEDFKSNSLTEKVAWYGKMSECSPYKDSWAGHWELAGWKYENKNDSSYWKKGFSDTVVNKFKEATNLNVLGNRAFLRREDVIYEYLHEHERDSNSVILLTEEGVESIRTFGIYALENIIPLETQYNICQKAADSLTEFRDIFGRIGARPLIYNGDKTVSVPHSDRKDFLIFDPPENTILDTLVESNIDTYGIGKIEAMFKGKSITHSVNTKNNVDGMKEIIDICSKIDKGFVWGNLNDFDAIYGHYFNTNGWINALEVFDKQLKELVEILEDDDLLIICSDGHGCDCVHTGIHTREYSPLIVYNKTLGSGYLNIDNILNDIAATIADAFNIEYSCNGTSILERCSNDK